MSLTLRSIIALTLFVGFYVFGVAVAVVLIWMAWTFADASTLKLAWGCVTTAGVVLWSMRPHRDHFAPPGPRVTEQDQPELFKVLKEVATAAKQPMPRDVFVAGDLTAWVADRGTIGGLGGHRVMTLGLPMMQLLTVAELKAVVAHEFGHFGAGDTSLGRVVHRAHLALRRSLEETEGNPVELLFRGYAALFLRVSMAVSRAQEFAADAFAAGLSAPHALASSLLKTEHASHSFPLFLHLEYSPLIQQGFRPPFTEGWARFQSRSTPGPSHVDLNNSTPEIGPYDSHPPTHERAAALARMDSKPFPGAAGDDTPALALLRDLAGLERDVLAVDGISVSTLVEIPWEEVPTRVWVPAWQEIVKKNVGALRRVSIEALPLSIEDAVAAGRSIGTPQAKLLDADDLAANVANSITVAVALMLYDAGWTLEDDGEGLRFRRGESYIAPFDPSLAAVSDDPAATATWAEFRRVSGLQGRLTQ
jgi:heat shock protein HtpX